MTRSNRPGCSMLDVRHQPTAHFLLQRALGWQRLPHAYAFHGPQGVGKEMLALRFARLLMCEARGPAGDLPPEYESLSAENWQDCCGRCRSCTLAEAGTHPDIHVVHRHLSRFHKDSVVRNRKALDLGIDVVRQFVIEPAGRKPAMCPLKVFVVRECHKLTTAAQNALLKTLEEPPADCYIILLTDALQRLLPTTRSRCQLVPFRLLPLDFMAARLADLRPKLDRLQVHYFARHESGSLGRALQLIDDGFFDCNEQLIRSLVDVRRAGALNLATTIEALAQDKAGTIQERQGSSMLQELAPSDQRSSRSSTRTASELTDTDATRQALLCLLGMAASVYRDVLNLSLGRESVVCNAAHADHLSTLSAQVAPEQVLQILQAIGQAESQLNQNANVRLCLENLAIQICRHQATPAAMR